VGEQRGLTRHLKKSGRRGKGAKFLDKKSQTEGAGGGKTGERKKPRHIGDRDRRFCYQGGA